MRAIYSEYNVQVKNEILSNNYVIHQIDSRDLIINVYIGKMSFHRRSMEIDYQLIQTHTQIILLH
jgi:hypothetical protein